MSRLRRPAVAAIFAAVLLAGPAIPEGHLLALAFAGIGLLFAELRSIAAADREMAGIAERRRRDEALRAAERHDRSESEP